MSYGIDDAIRDKYYGHALGATSTLLVAALAFGTVGWINDWSERTIDDIDPKTTLNQTDRYLSGWPLIPQLKMVTQSFNKSANELCRDELTITAPLFIPADIEEKSTCKVLTAKP